MKYPKRKAYTKKYYKRKPRNKTLFKGYVTKFKLPPTIIERFTYKLMRIAFPVTITAVIAGNVSYQNINIGSIYDPVGSSGTRTYYGAGTMHTLYRYASILSIKYRLQAMASTTGGVGDSNPFMIIARIQSENSIDVNIDSPEDFYEVPFRSNPGVKMFGNYITKNLNGNNAIYGSYSAKKYYGKDISSDVDYASSVSSNPTYFPKLGLYWCIPSGTSTSSQEMTMMCMMTAIVKWWGPQSLNND